MIFFTPAFRAALMMLSVPLRDPSYRTCADFPPDGTGEPVWMSTSTPNRKLESAHRMQGNKPTLEGLSQVFGDEILYLNNLQSISGLSMGSSKVGYSGMSSSCPHGIPLFEKLVEDPGADVASSSCQLVDSQDLNNARHNAPLRKDVSGH